MTMLPMARPVDPNWQCCRSGDCCTKIEEVVMTRAERTAILPRIIEGIVTVWRDLDESFVALKAGPCPLYVFGDCTVYDVRPYNCRRFVCLRPDVTAEPFEANGANMMDRVVTSRPMRRLAQRVQQKAQQWAASHGWPTLN